MLTFDNALYDMNKVCMFNTISIQCIRALLNEMSIMSYGSRFTCVKFILNTNSHHHYECIEMMYTNLAIPILAHLQVYNQQRDLY